MAGKLELALQVAFASCAERSKGWHVAHVGLQPTISAVQQAPASKLSWGAPARRFKEHARNDAGVNVVHFQVLDGADGIAAFLNRDRVVNNVTATCILARVTGLPARGAGAVFLLHRSHFLILAHY